MSAIPLAVCFDSKYQAKRKIDLDYEQNRVACAAMKDVSPGELIVFLVASILCYHGLQMQAYPYHKF